MAEFIPYEEFQSKSKEEQADILRQLIDTHGMKQVIENWKISKAEYHNLVDELDIVVRRGRKPKAEKVSVPSKAIKKERKARAKKKAAEQQPPTTEQLQFIKPEPLSAKLFFNLEGEYKGTELSPILTGLSRMVEGQGEMFKVTIVIKR